MNIMTPVAASVKDCPVYKISEKDTNKFVLLCDGSAYPYMNCVEIFDVGGQTPPNTHQAAFEHFYVIAGSGVATVGGETYVLSVGAHLFVPPSFDHKVENTGSGKLYVLTTMIPDENFTALINSGIAAKLDEEDLRVLCQER